jgi:PAS domain S-box-containing protein
LNTRTPEHLNTKSKYKELQSRIAQLESELEKKSFELTQRIRELKSVLEITTAGDQVSRTTDDFLLSALEIVVASFQYPEITCAELKIGELVYRTENFRVTQWKLGRGLMQDNHMIGYLTVYYLEEKPEEDHGPFTKEEKNLLVLITRYLVEIIRRKRYEDELDKFRQVISQAQTMIMITGIDNKAQYVNEKFSEVMGYTLEELDEMGGEVTPRDEEGRATRKMIMESLYSTGRFTGELQVVSKSGRQFWVRAWASIIQKNSRPEYFVGIFEDITEERELLRKHHEGQERLNMIMENIPVSITLMDSEGYFIFYNKEAKKNLQQSTEALKQHPIQKIFPGEGANTLKTIRNVFATKQPLSSEVSYIIEGREQYFQVNRLPLFDDQGNVTSVISISHNITARKQEEKLIRIQKAIDSLNSIGQTFEGSLKIMFDNLFELNWLDAAGIYLVDEKEQRLDLIYHRGLSPSFVKLTSSYSFDSQNAAVVFNKEPRYVTLEQYLSSSNEDLIREKITFVAALPLVYEDRALGLLNLASRKVTGIEETDRYAVENIATKIANLIELINTREMLKATNLELTKKVMELQEKQDLLVQKSKLESLGEIAAGLAHEINQPLSVISLAFENIIYKLMQVEAQTDYFAKKSDLINLNIEKIRQLIDHIRVFSRDQSSVMFEKVDLNLAIKNTLSLLKVQLFSHHIRLTLDLAEDSCFTLGNLTKMEQVMMNLISNARDAVDEKGLSMKGQEYTQEISIKTYARGGHVVMVIEDNGTGIRKENLDKIYNPFFTTKPPGHGTGLGLSIVYGIITEMKGKIEVESVFSKFTRIKIFLPKI